MKLIGLARVGRDAELRYVPSGEAVINIALAYNYGKKEAGNNQPTQWVDAALWGKRAEALAQYIVKGQQFLVEVRDAHIEIYQKTGGGEGSKLVGTVADIEFAGPAPQQQAAGGQQGGQQRSAPAAQNRSQSQQQRPAARQPAGGGSTGFDDMDDDIPF